MAHLARIGRIVGASLGEDPVGELFGIVPGPVAQEGRAAVVDRAAVIGRDAVDHRKARDRRVDGAFHQVHEVPVRQPAAQRAGIAHRGAGQDAQAHGLQPPLVPEHPAQVLGEALGQPVIGVGPVRGINADGLGLGVHPHRVNRRGIDHPGQAVLMGGFPDVVGPHDVGPQDIIEGGLVTDGAEMHHHVGAFQQVHDRGPVRQVGAQIGLVRQKIRNAIDDVGTDQRVAHLRQRPPQDGSEPPGSPGQDEFLHRCLLAAQMTAPSTIASPRATRS